MDERKNKILYSVIQDFIFTGEPVGSKTLSKKYNLGVSSATIRNEMSNLEELGFLEQVHTSSGRIPSNKGYRLYVDKLMKPTPISKQEEVFIKSDLMNLNVFDIENVLKSKLIPISKLTNLACILKIPSLKESSIKSIQFIKIGDKNLLFVVITKEGIIRNNVIKVDNILPYDMVNQINNVINKILYDNAEGKVSEIIEKLKLYLKLNDYVFEKISSILYDVFECGNRCEFYVEGINNILNYPEFRDINKIKNILHFFDNKLNFESLLICDRGDDIEIRIGEENYVEGAQNYSLVLGNYKKDSMYLGTLGIIGPTRMDYSKVVSILRSLIDVINLNID